MERTGNLPHAQYRRFDGMREFEALVDDMIPQTQSVIRVFDKALSREYNSPRRYEALRQFLLASRSNRLMIVLHEADPIARQCPRVIDLARQFSSAVKIHQTLRPARHVYDPLVIFDATHYLHRFHYDHLRAAQGMNDVIGAQQLLDRFTEIWEASAPAISFDKTGL
ncbi:MAG: hypothetical protein OEP48_02875 [Betaproteobacteria bacterium]|nr:hypothetical protein [Betaproteobacteria bacterium]MDH3437925.1 hypothetical protein [Betaproteobacteria bacterium]